MTYHIHIAEDLPRLAKMLRENLELSPDFKVIGQAEDGQELLEQLTALPTLAAYRADGHHDAPPERHRSNGPPESAAPANQGRDGHRF